MSYPTNDEAPIIKKVIQITFIQNKQLKYEDNNVPDFVFCLNSRDSPIIKSFAIPVLDVCCFFPGS